MASVQTGVTLGKFHGQKSLKEYPYLRVANVQDGFLDLTMVKTLQLPPNEASSSFLRHGDVLMTEGGDIDKLGRGYIWQGEIDDCLHQNHIFAVRADREKLLPEYLVTLMTSLHGRAYFQLTAKQTTNLASTNATTLRAFPAPLPSVKQQLQILDHITEESRELELGIERANRQIDLLREYRTRLIADVVTGKLDVRAAAAALPEDDPDEALDDLPDDLDEMEDEPEEQETADVTD